MREPGASALRKSRASYHAMPHSSRVLGINTFRMINTKGYSTPDKLQTRWVLQWTRSPDLATAERHLALSQLPESTAARASTPGLCNGRNMAELARRPNGRRINPFVEQYDLSLGAGTAWSASKDQPAELGSFHFGIGEDATVLGASMARSPPGLLASIARIRRLSTIAFCSSLRRMAGASGAEFPLRRTSGWGLAVGPS